MTADHWGFVLAAYGIAAVALGAYWRHLCRRDRELTAHASETIDRKAKRSPIRKPAAPSPLQ
jgi:hypothetical protein